MVFNPNALSDEEYYRLAKQFENTPEKEALQRAESSAMLKNTVSRRNRKSDVNPVESALSLARTQVDPGFLEYYDRKMNPISISSANVSDTPKSNSILLPSILQASDFIRSIPSSFPMPYAKPNQIPANNSVITPTLNTKSGNLNKASIEDIQAALDIMGGPDAYGDLDAEDIANIVGEYNTTGDLATGAVTSAAIAGLAGPAMQAAAGIARPLVRSSAKKIANALPDSFINRIGDMVSKITNRNVNINKPSSSPSPRIYEPEPPRPGNIIDDDPKIRLIRERAKYGLDDFLDKVTVAPSTMPTSSVDPAKAYIDKINSIRREYRIANHIPERTTVKSEGKIELDDLDDFLSQFGVLPGEPGTSRILRARAIDNINKDIIKAIDQFAGNNTALPRGTGAMPMGFNNVIPIYPNNFWATPIPTTKPTINHVSKAKKIRKRKTKKPII